MILPLFLSKIREICIKKTLQELSSITHVASRYREMTINVATRYRGFCTGDHMIQSGHMKSCAAAEKRFMKFKEPGSFEQV